MTPFQQRMKESKARQATIRRLAKKTPPMTQKQIADEVKCSKAYVNQVLKAAQ